MNDSNRIRYELRAEVFKALAHPMRIHMLEKLRQSAWCVCKLATELGIDKSVASKHLSQLRSVGLIDVVKRGTCAEYRLVAPCILDMTECAEKAALDHKSRNVAVE